MIGFPDFIVYIFYIIPGIAPNTMLAKVCSDKNKPNGQFRIHPRKEEVTEFIANLPIRKVFYLLSFIFLFTQMFWCCFVVILLYFHQNNIFELFYFKLKKKIKGTNFRFFFFF